ncbi:MAG: two component transcriptional regulator, winged helix family [Hyphomicrobiales bacterium]|nr:two component transcriptional regulator, winged helix family [Hyphomicrobiales bacterium]
MRILLVEDSARLSDLIAGVLKGRGFAVDAVDTAADADASLSCNTYDLVILDLGLPDMDGMDLLKELRQRKVGVPILVLTARDGSRTLIDGLNGGADDFLRKPFDMDELIARTNALLRRPGSPLGVRLAEGNVTFDTIERDILISDQRINLTRLEASALELLMRRSGRVVAKSTLEDSLYGFTKEVESNAIEVVLHRLRRKLQTAGSTINIHALRGVGYILSNTP